jgi:hypothetical protein
MLGADRQFKALLAPPPPPPPPGRGRVTRRAAPASAACTAARGGTRAGQAPLLGGQQYLGHRNIQHTMRYAELTPQRFQHFWED